MATSSDAKAGSASQLSLTIVLNQGEKVLPLAVGANTTVAGLKRLIAAEWGLPASDQKLLCKGRALDDAKSLVQNGVSDKDFLEVKSQAVLSLNNLQSLSQIPAPVWQKPAQLQEVIKANPKLLNQLLHQNPTLAEAVMAPGTLLLESYFREQQRARAEAKRREDLRIAQLQADPLDPTSQAKIAEILRERNVRDNMEQAMEHNPESFGSVVMLYIPCTVNKVPLKAFVDSGAQMTIMSLDCAKRVGLARLIDRRWRGVAKGVGTANIIGRIHAAPIQIGSAYFTMSITILESKDMQFLFGLDQLKRHQAVIDLKANCLRIQGQNVKFLAEKDIPRSERSGAAASSDGKSKAAGGSAGAPSAQQPSKKKQKTEARQPPPRAGPSASAAAAPAPLQTFQRDLATLKGMGFSEQQARQALAACGGNVEMAASMLYQQMGAF